MLAQHTKHAAQASHKSSVSALDKEIMLASGHFEQARPGTQVTSLAFSLEELSKIPPRRRSILWPPCVNSALEDAFNSRVKDCVGACTYLPGDHARILDLPAGFYQIPMVKEIRELYAFFAEQDKLQPTKMPMGVTFACDLLEAVLAVLVWHAKKAAPPDSVRSWTHVDNIRFLSQNREHVDAVANEMIQLIHGVGMEIREEPTTTF